MSINSDEEYPKWQFIADVGVVLVILGFIGAMILL